MSHGSLGSRVARRFRKTGIQLVKLRSGLSTKEAIELYKKDPNIEYAEPNYKLYAVAVYPNDVLGYQLWGLHNQGQDGGTPDADIDAPEAWQTTTGSGDVIVAVIDTGVDYDHDDLSANMWVNIAERDGTPGVDDDGNGYVDDIYGIDTVSDDANPWDDRGHGTHCAGTIGAVGNNEIGVVGVNWNVKIMALKFLDAGGNGWTDDAIDCLEYAIMMKQDYGQNIRVTNNSWGGAPYSQSLYDTIQEAADADILFIAAAGNDSDNTDANPTYPSSYDLPNIISVAATDRNDNLASFSNWGLTSVDVAAPGEYIYSTFPIGADLSPTCRDMAYGYGPCSGTSMAAPHVSGLAALILALVPTHTWAEVKSAILATVDPIASLQGLILTGGRINAERALFSVCNSEGNVRLDREAYSPGVDINVEVLDADLNTDPLVIEQYPNVITITTTGGDQESSLILTETGPSSCIFAGTIVTAADAAVEWEDGIVQTSCYPADTIITTYHDADDGTGSPANVSDTAHTDCLGPEITNVEVTDIGHTTATVTWNTDESSNSCVYYGATIPEEPSGWEFGECQSSLVTDHRIILTGLGQDTTYYFEVASTDEAGNLTIDDNNGQYFQFHSYVPGIHYVPDDFTTIQVAINGVLDGDEIVVKNGTYYELIDFLGKAITVRSENGPTTTIIDGGNSDGGPAVVFWSGEGADSVLDGFTITNGDGIFGGGISAVDNSPTISNCIITGNRGEYGGGILDFGTTGATITNCVITNNTVTKHGGGIYTAAATITNCIIRDNVASWEGGGISLSDWGGDTSSVITNCIISNNTADDGGGIRCVSTSPIFVNCTISGNSATSPYGGGMYCYDGNGPTVVNSILWDNTAYGSPNEVYLGGAGTSIDITYSDVKGGWAGTGNIAAEPFFVDAGHGNFHLQSASPCVDAGNDAAPGLPVIDFEGDDRVVDGDDNGTATVDMGADEFDPNILRADFRGDPSTGIKSLTVQFTDQSTGSPTTWLWDFDNDGTIDSYDQNPVFEFTEVGDVTVALTVSGLTGSDTEIKENYISVKALCECDMVPDMTAVHRGGTLGFQATVTNNSNLSGSVYFGTKVKLPSGTMYPPSGLFDGPYQLSMNPYGLISQHFSHNTSGWPLGTYIYYGLVGIPGVVVFDVCQFEFEVKVVP
jgi:PKD repeat protein